jgi:septal ring factor EnvC (AmiA/AmiB activator)
MSCSAWASNISKLQTQLGTTRSQLGSTESREQSLSAKIQGLDAQVNSLAGQVSLVQSRENEARARLAQENAQLAQARGQVAQELVRLARLRRILHLARRALAAELVSQYEQPQESFISLLVNAGGFQQLLDQIQYVSSARQHEQTVLLVARRAQAETVAASQRLLDLEVQDARAAGTTATQASALEGMSSLLTSREQALADERSAQSTALAATKAKGAQLTQAIATIQRQEAAAEAAAQAVTVSAPSSASTPGSSGSATQVSSSGGWAIPYAVVLCESGGQNLPPNGAGASGYYQIIPSTWRAEGGSGPAAYLAPKSEQDAVAARLWNGGAGASNWTCSRIVGIT